MIIYILLTIQTPLLDDFTVLLILTYALCVCKNSLHNVYHVSTECNLLSKCNAVVITTVFYNSTDAVNDIGKTIMLYYAYHLDCYLCAFSS